MRERDVVGQAVEALDTPVLLVDAELLEQNLAAMRERVAARGIAYRPHTKSHKSPIVAKEQIAAGAQGVCCAKLGEAEVLAAGGVTDLHITTPVVGSSKAQRLAVLA